MKTLEERAKSMADWFLRRIPIFKYFNLTKMFADMLTEQRAIDIDKAIKAHCKLCKAHDVCVERGAFYCLETAYIKRIMEE